MVVGTDGYLCLTGPTAGRLPDHRDGLLVNQHWFLAASELRDEMLWLREYTAEDLDGARAGWRARGRWAPGVATEPSCERGSSAGPWLAVTRQRKNPVCDGVPCGGSYRTRTYNPLIKSHTHE